MKLLILKIMIWTLDFVYLFYKLLPVRNKIVMISRQSDKVNEDFKLLGDELSKKHQVVYLCKTLEGGVDSDFKTRLIYGFHIFKQMYHLASSRVCVLDSYSPVVSVLHHKKSLTVIQMWHSVGTLKRFGWQILGIDEGSSAETARTMQMHNNYDVIYCASKAYVSDLAEGFNAPHERFKIFTLPRIDLLKNKEYMKKTRERILSEYPVMKDKPNVVYAPTFRKNERDFNKSFNELVGVFDFSKYNLVVKLHPLSRVKVNNDNIIFDKDFSTFEMLSVANKLISDYSCVIYEAGVIDIPLYFYNYDADVYENVRGLTIDYNQLPGYKEQTAQALADSLELPYDMDYLRKYIKKYVTNTDNCALKMAKDIESYM